MFFKKCYFLPSIHIGEKSISDSAEVKLPYYSRSVLENKLFSFHELLVCLWHNSLLNRNAKAALQQCHEKQFFVFLFFFSLTSSAHIWKQIKPRILETLAVCLTELCASDFYWVFFLWYSSFVINLPRFFEVAFQADDLRHSQNNYQIRLYKLNSMCEKLSYQIINTSAVNQTVFCYYQKFAKIIIKKKTLVSAVASNTGMHFFGFI